MSIEQNKATIQRLFEEVYNAKQVAVLDELLTADYVDHNLAQGLQNKGRQGWANLSNLLTQSSRIIISPLRICWPRGTK